MKKNKEHVLINMPLVLDNIKESIPKEEYEDNVVELFPKKDGDDSDTIH